MTVIQRAPGWERRGRRWAPAFAGEREDAGEEVREKTGFPLPRENGWVRGKELGRWKRWGLVL